MADEPSYYCREEHSTVNNINHKLTNQSIPKNLVVPEHQAKKLKSHKLSKEIQAANLEKKLKLNKLSREFQAAQLENILQPEDNQKQQKIPKLSKEFQAAQLENILQPEDNQKQQKIPKLSREFQAAQLEEQLSAANHTGDLKIKQFPKRTSNEQLSEKLKSKQLSNTPNGHLTKSVDLSDEIKSAAKLERSKSADLPKSHYIHKNGIENKFNLKADVGGEITTYNIISVSDDPFSVVKLIENTKEVLV